MHNISTPLRVQISQYFSLISVPQWGLAPLADSPRKYHLMRGDSHSEIVMFEIGSLYVITTWEGSDDGGVSTQHPWCNMLAYEPPLLKLERGGKQWIINTSSPAFVRAELQPPPPEKIGFDINFVDARKP
jgi:hypothetical protein